MTQEIQNEEITVDFTKIFKVLNYRRKLIFKVFLAVVTVFIALAYVMPKKYATDADLYINKSNDTNLAEMNPYVLSYLTNNGGLSGMLSSNGGNTLQNEIEIMKSPLVMDRVIKENDIRYKAGKKKGELISTRDFLRKNLAIESEKGTSIVSISYKSRTPELSYNVVNSIIKNYQAVNAEINTRKAQKDKALLEDSYEATNKAVNEKLSAMKNVSTMPQTAMTSIGVLAALKGHNRAISSSLGAMQGQMIEGQRSQISIEQDVEKLKLVKSKLEWTNLVERLSQDATNVIVLKQPEIKRPFEQSSPKLFTSLIMGISLGVLASILAVILIEKTDGKLTYSDLGEKIIYNIADNVDELKILLLANPSQSVSVVDFNGFQEEFTKDFQNFTNLKFIKAEISKSVIDELASSDKLIFAGRIGKTPKKIYGQLKNLCVEAGKKIYFEVV